MFSVLIANFNNSRFLHSCLTSVVQQTYENWEAIIVDDGSTDEFEQEIAPFSTNPKIKIFRNLQNMGCGFTKNKCASLAVGEILAFLDPDDALHPDALSVMEAAHKLRPDCSLIHSGHYICDELLRVKRIAEYTGGVPSDLPYLFLSDGRVHHFTSFKKKNYDNTTGISPVFKKAVDQDLYYQLEEQGALFFINQPLYYYRIHPGAISNAGREKEATLWHYQVIEAACIRRINIYRHRKDQLSRRWTRKYRTRLHKIKILKSFRKKNWLSFLFNMAVFPFVGGLKDLKNYAGKLLAGESGLLRKTFTENYEIKA